MTSRVLLMIPCSTISSEATLASSERESGINLDKNVCAVESNPGRRIPTLAFLDIISIILIRFNDFVSSVIGNALNRIPACASPWLSTIFHQRGDMVKHAYT